MTFKRSFTVLSVLLVLFAGAFAAQAQDEAQPEAEAQSLELTESSELGEISVAHPEGWSLIDAQGGAVILTNLDMAAPQQELPPETLVLQFSFFGLDFIPSLTRESTNAEILTELLADLEQEVETVDVTVDDVALSTFEIAREEGEATVYIRRLSDATFLLTLAESVTEGRLADAQDAVSEMVASLAFDVTAPLAETPGAAYDDLQVSRSERGFPQLGDPEAPVVVTEISSFDCPACGQFHDVVLPQLLDSIASGDVLFRYVPVFGTGGIPDGLLASYAALCAGQQDSFWSYHDALFNWQQFGARAFTSERLLLGAEGLGLDVEQWTSCITNDEQRSVLQGSQEYIQSEVASFSGTPTVLVNGEPTDWQSEILFDAIDNALDGGDAEGESTEETAESTEETAESTEEATESTEETETDE